jgi:hypothetical protein
MPKRACGAAWFGGISRLIGFSHVGSGPWFGAADAMDDLMPPGGAGTLVTSSLGRGRGDGPESGRRNHEGRNLPFYHLPLCCWHEVVGLLQPAPGKLIFDGTLGGGGHSEALLQHGARVVAMDQDEQALRHATDAPEALRGSFCALRGNFRNFPQIVEEAGVSGFDGMLVDIGVSSHQLDDGPRLLLQGCGRWTCAWTRTRRKPPPIIVNSRMKRSSCASSLNTARSPTPAASRVRSSRHARHVSFRRPCNSPRSSPPHRRSAASVTRPPGVSGAAHRRERRTRRAA